MVLISKESSIASLEPLLFNIITGRRSLVAETFPPGESRFTISMDELTQRTGASKKEIRQAMRGLFENRHLRYREVGGRRKGKSIGQNRFRILEMPPDTLE